jgi:hypothetical protein
MHHLLPVLTYPTLPCLLCPRFYTLMVLSTALFGKPPFKNLICNGLVLAADGKKMSKRLQNYPVSQRVCVRIAPVNYSQLRHMQPCLPVSW